MTRSPGARVIRALVPVTLSAALAAAPLWGVSPIPSAQAITPEQATAAGYIPNPAPAFARIAIDEVTPRVLADNTSGGGMAAGTESGVPVVTVSGTVTNVGDTPLEAVDVRLQRGPRAADASAARDALVWSEPSFGVRGEFVRVSESLAPGESVPFSLSMPASAVPGGTDPDLQLTEPGVYPLLVNLNGTPQGAAPARLDDARTLLPVLEAPRPSGLSGIDDDDEIAPAPPAVTPGPAPASVPLTILWPLASAPTRIAAVPGADGPDPVVMLTNGSLLDELSDTGRLTGLVRAADEAFSGPGGQELRRATCLAVDPDLVGTVSQIADGRTVLIDDGNGPVVPEEERSRSGREGERRPSTPADPGSIAADAGRWLDELRALADGGCVVALPAAQADLETVAEVGSPDLTRAALDRGEMIERIIGVEPLPNVLVPASGTLTPDAATALTGQGSTAIVAAASTRTDTGLVPPPGMVGLAGTPGERALTYSDTVGSALAATGEVPENPRYSDPTTRYWLTADSAQARLQDARASLLAPLVDVADATPSNAGSPGDRAANPAGTLADAAGAAPAAGEDASDTSEPTTFVPGTPAAEAVEQGVLAVPPQVWSIDRDSAGSLLETLDEQLSAGRMRATPLPDRLSGPVTVPDGSLAPDPTGATDPGEVDPFAQDPGGSTAQRLTAALDGIGTLRSLVDTSDPTSSGAADHLDPLLGDALRAISATGRRAGGDGVTVESGTGSAARLRIVNRLDRLRDTIDASLARVDLLPPGSVFTMASPNSPLLLVIRNGLPFPVRVDVDVAAPEDLHVDPVGTVQLPTAGSRTLQAPTQSDAGGGARRAVSFALTTPDGRPLSQPVELSVQTGGYPVAQGFALAAAALALVLGGRRYLRYRRGILDPADEGHRP
ncbi:hypothetical protein [Dietzia aurantiaca]|uniref:hypothetical protein n=1 Tax=Dietzia aurantiaca TaxID=983873 RepID=UPI001E5DEC85|nr:hypothetical protein [Dietzia aurantiaca]